MIIQKNSKNRLAIFFFFDEEGIVDDYIIYLLNSIRHNIKHLLVVSNGQLCFESKKKLKTITDVILERENKGFDVWAYKEGLEYYGWKELSTYDEVILFNYTIFGPLYPFEEMFEEMNQRDIDFWGITKHHKVDYDSFGTCKYGYIPEHIQSSFLVLRRTLIESKEYQNFWKDMPMINSYADSVGYYEAIFTKDFVELGFKESVYINTEDLREYTRYPLLMMSYELVKNRRCPVIKRKSFCQTYFDMLSETIGEATLELYNFIQENLDYDVNLIWDNILRTCHMSDIKDMMHLNYILPDRDNFIFPNKQGYKVALVIHLYFEDLLEKSFYYASSIPDYADVYVTTDTIKKKKAIEEKFKELKCHKFQCIIIENQGRDVSALLVGTKDFIMNYDIVCFAHDKKTTQLKPHCIGEGFAYKCFENILGTKNLVMNILKTFEENPRLGLLVPPPPNHAAFYQTLYSGWADNYANVCKLLKQFDISIPIYWSKEPIAPLGTMFWFRPKAMKSLFDKDWEYADFPKEPNAMDGTLLHAIERAYPYFVQKEGYYSAWVMSEKFARIEITNLYYLLRIAVKNNNNMNSSIAADANTEAIRNISFFNIFRIKLRNKIPKRIWNSLRKIYHIFR